MADKVWGVRSQNQYPSGPLVIKLPRTNGLSARNVLRSAGVGKLYGTEIATGCTTDDDYVAAREQLW